MKSLGLSVVSSLAFCTVWAADATYIWPDVGSELTVAYDEDDQTKVKTITANVAAGDTVTLSGSAIDFAAGAKIELAGFGNLVVSNTLTGTDGLLVTNTAAKSGLLTYKGAYLQTATSTTLFPGCDLDDITILYADNAHSGVTGMSNPQVHYPHFVRRATVDGVKTMTLQMQIQYPYASALSGSVTKCVEVELKQEGADVVGRAIDAYGCFNNVEGLDMVAAYQRNPGRQGLSDLRVWKVVVKISKDVGAYGIASLTAEWAGAAHLSLRGDVTALGGTLSVANGALVDTLGVSPAKGPTSLDVKGKFTAGNAKGTASGTVVGTRGGTIVYEATQPGSWTNTLTGVNSTKDNDARQNKADSSGYVIVKGNSAAGAYMTCDLNSWTCLPTNGFVDVYDGGTLRFSKDSHGGNSAYQNDSVTYRIHTGGTLVHLKNHATARVVNLELRGGRMEVPDKTNPAELNFYCNRLLMMDGAVVNGDERYPNANMWAGGNAAATWTVRGSSPSYFNPPLAYVTSCTHTLDVEDVTNDDAPDFIFARPIRKYSNGTHTIRKIGSGTVLCQGTVALTGGLIVSNGTWQLGISDSWQDKRALTLSGGTFAVSNNTSNAIGTLKVEAAGGTIELGEGATLTFADSKALAWSGTGLVKVKGYRKNSIQFGEDATALTAAQQRRLRTAEGAKLHLDSDGYLIPFGFMLSIQ